ncbi:MAG: alanine--tRNA ligase [Prevotellaceae bacterium]|jgi:alanyl-tRNA synthetase|nr:alanine--tRNA ligase [Prevotellaceae bacterium]
MNSKDIRLNFLNFFKAKQHVIVPSAPMVVTNDPTLMFTNAGMNQFKDIFLGNAPAKNKRVADTQKCLRVSGKHNDLEEVGYDTYHHTMFEMLGNWSFGDYFKEKAIEWAWELLVDVYKLNPERLYATVCEGSADDGLAADAEAAEYWAKFLPKDRILLGCKKDNFWEMGDTGPCGPCSEVHIDLRDDEDRKKIDGKDLVNKGNPLVIEIWNLVFIQYNRKADSSLELLPEKHVDTGMGFERLCMAVQGKKSNYDTDVFQPIIQKIAQIANKKYGAASETDIAMRVIADHLRAICFSIADGQLPSNNKAGYVIRRILRRAVRYGYTFLNFNQPFINKLVPELVNLMGDAFPELKSQQTLIEKVIIEEETAFLRTIENGIRLLDNVIAKTKAENNTVIDGKSAFVLYDTYGFPIDLTELIARENNLTIDEEEFNCELNMQKKRSRNAAAIEADDWTVIKEIQEEEFLGYDETELDVEISRYRIVKTKSEETVHLVFDKTPFYGESGGQVGDSGTIESQSETIEIINTIKENNLIIHVAKRLPKNTSAKFRAKVNIKQRTATANNHTATHLLHYALRKILGTHVEQKGSLVNPNYLRFDFAHFQKMSDEEIQQVEKSVNEKIRENQPLNENRHVPIHEARSMGAIALFGEKYADVVRVIKFGDSVELCGGTHAAATGQIGFFKIISESAIAAGVRRIEATTGENAENIIYEFIDSLKQIRQLFNNSPAFIQSIKKSIEENENLKKQLDDLIQKKIKSLKHKMLENIEHINGINVVRSLVSVNADKMKNIVFEMRKEIEKAVIVIGCNDLNKPVLMIAISDDLVASGKNAGNIVREAAKEIQGGGGGQPFFATAGGKNAEGLANAITKAVDLVILS